MTPGVEDPPGAGAFAITARDARRPNEGSVILAFAGSPVRLQEWTITDAQKKDTSVMIFNVQTGMALDDKVFQIPYDEVRNKKGG